MPARLDEQLSSALRVEVPAETRESVRVRVMEELDRLLVEKPAPPPRPRRPWDILKLRLLALGSATIVVVGAGTAVAAAAAGPDSWLYPVKQDLESVRADLARGSLSEASYQVGRAGKRLDEVDAMVTAGKPQYVPDLLSQYDSTMQRAAQLREEAAENGEDTSRVDAAFTATVSRHDEQLKSLSGQLPDDLRQQLIESGEMAIGPAASEPHEDITPPSGAPAVGNGNPENGQQQSAVSRNESAEVPDADVNSGGAANEQGNQSGRNGSAMEQESSYLPTPDSHYEQHPSSDDSGSSQDSDGQPDDNSQTEAESGQSGSPAEHTISSHTSLAADSSSAAGSSRH